uniref:RNA polymerase II-associated factor 1 homolog n=1 Tax=Gallus gallus TaxID=9031 RepID=A0A8V0XVQ2_CHICK
MAPTIQTQAQREEPGHRPGSHRTLPERSGVVCRVKYCNSLPDIPFDPKFITYPFDQNRFVQYKATSLEKQHKHDLLTEPDLGVTIDLINPDTYRIDPSGELGPEGPLGGDKGGREGNRRWGDAGGFLWQCSWTRRMRSCWRRRSRHPPAPRGNGAPGPTLEPAGAQLSPESLEEPPIQPRVTHPTLRPRSQQHAKVVPWMRKTEYISTEFNRYGVSNEKPEVKIGVSVKQQFTEEEIYKDRDSQIAAIEKTFEDAQKAITQHYSKPRVTPLEVMPVFPDFKMWINPCAQVIFDSDPAPKDTSGAAALEMMSQAMIRGMMDEEGNQFVAYFLPVEETLRKRKRDQEEEMDYAPEDVYDYKIAREYNWNVKNKASKGYEENYFFIFREGDGVYYNELETRVRLSKRRARAGVQSGTNAVLVVKHRDMNEKELEAQEARRAQLENHEPEEEEEEEMEAEKEAPGSDEEREKGSESEGAASGEEEEEAEGSGASSSEQGGSAHSEDDAEDEEEEAARGARRGGSDAARAARDQEEIFGSDDDEDEEDDDDEEESEGGGSEGGPPRSPRLSPSEASEDEESASEASDSSSD